MTVFIREIATPINIYSIDLHNSILYFGDGTMDRYVEKYNVYAYNILTDSLNNLFSGPFSGPFLPDFGLSSIGISSDGTKLFGCGSDLNQVYYANINGLSASFGSSISQSSFDINLGCCQGNIIVLNNSQFIVANGARGNLALITIDSISSTFTLSDWTKIFKIGKPVGVTTDGIYIYSIDRFDNTIIRTKYQTTLPSSPLDVTRINIPGTTKPQTPSDIVYYNSKLYITDSQMSIFIYDVSGGNITFSTIITPQTQPFAITKNGYFSRASPLNVSLGVIPTFNIISRLL